MISKSRIRKIKKALIRDLDKFVDIKFEDGNEIKVTGAEICDSFVNYREGTDFTRAIQGKEIVSCSSYEKLISIIHQLVEHPCEELED